MASARRFGGVVVATWMMACTTNVPDGQPDAGMDATASIPDAPAAAPAVATVAPPPAVHDVVAHRKIDALIGGYAPLATALQPRLEGLAEHESLFASAAFRKDGRVDPSHLGATFPSQADRALRFSPARSEAWSLRLTPIGARPAVGALDEGRVYWDDAYASTDIAATSAERHAEWTLLLKDAKAPTTFRWTVAMGKGLHVQRTGTSIDFLDKRNDPALRIETPWLVDAQGTRREVAMELAGDELTLTIDPKGLTYPIVVDPVVSVPTWIARTPIPGSPAARNHTALAYVSAGAPGIVIFGGEKIGPTQTAEAFRWDGTSWIDIADPVVNPTAGHAAATWKGQYVYFGGCTGAGCGTLLNASAFSDGFGWGPFCGIGSPACGITARKDHAMASTSNYLVVLGGTVATSLPLSANFAVDGKDSSGQPAADLWVLSSSAPANTFTQVTAVGTRPVVRRNASMAGSPSTILLFGGYNSGYSGSNGFLSDTWLLNPATSTWTPVCGSPGRPFCTPGPSGRLDAGLAWDSNRARFILVGGYRSNGAGAESGDDTWEFDPATNKWNLLCGVSEGGAPCYSGVGTFNSDDPKLAYDPARRRMFRAGGYSFGYRADSFELYVRGGSCSVDADCDMNAGGAAAYCIEGTCCEQNCDTCQTCVDPASPGVCKNVASGSADPRGRCAGSTLCNGSSTAAACQPPNGTACTLDSQCSSNHCVNSTCCSTSSCAPGFTCATPGGVCKKSIGQTCAITTDCASGFCANGYCCGSACSGGGQRCDYARAPGTCLKSSGAACSAGSECGDGAGNCVDGVCCTSACPGQCQACAEPGSPGICTTIIGSPRGARAACGGSGACGSTCNGSSAASCVYPGAGSSCGALSCSAGVQTNLGNCNGGGGCTQTTTPCSAFTCGATACKTSCTVDTDCASSSYYCSGGACQLKAANGSTCASSTSCQSGNCASGVCCNTACTGAGFACNLPTSPGKCAKAGGTACTAGSECGTGNCVDGVCCDSACNGQCQACDAGGSVGKCTAVSGIPHGTRTACTGTGAGTTCGPTCDGTTTSACTYPSGTKTCGAATCTDGSAVSTYAQLGFCSGAGSCTAGGGDCGTYKCSGSACAKTCTAKGDCSSGNYCKSGLCVPFEGLGNACTDATACPSGFCTDGVCCGSATCGSGASCNASVKSKGKCAKLNGSKCATPAECDSGNCIDGFCCNSSCSGSCESCNLPSAEGTCTPIVGQPLPGHPACSATPTDLACGLRCNGTDAKACHDSAPSASCGVASCAAGIENDVSTCDGSGTCKSSTRSCGAYACGATACLTSCADDSGCAKANFCKAGACVGVQALGESCAGDSQCTSGHCTDGVCCGVASCGSGAACAGPGASAGTCLKGAGASCGAAGECASAHCVDGLCCDKSCDGQCEACDIKGSEGSCTPVTGAPHAIGKGRAACDALDAADCAKAACNGAARDKCAGFVNGTTTICGTASCTADKRFQKKGACDGKGGCGYPDPKSCVPYACDVAAPSGCGSTCSTDDQCASGFTCKTGSCVQGATCSDDGLSSIDKSGVSTSCLPYRCGSDGLCSKACASSDDCAPATVCQTDVKACVVPSTESQGGGCNVGEVQGSEGQLGFGAAALTLLLGLARRRRGNGTRRS